jgi:hypothetical protein
MQNNDEEVLEAEHQNLPPEVQALLRQGRKAQRETEALKAQLAQEQLTVAIERAGVPAHPLRDLAFKEYSGPTDPEAIKAHAEKMGLTVTPAAPASSGPTDQEISAQRQILNAGGGAPAANGDVDLAVALRNAKSSSEVLSIVGQMAGNPGFRNHDGLVGILPEY